VFAGERERERERERKSERAGTGEIPNSDDASHCARLIILSSVSPVARISLHLPDSCARNFMARPCRDFVTLPTGDDEPPSGVQR